MGSAKSAGSGSESYDYYATIFIGLGEGPIDAIVSILEDGKEIWHGPLLRSGAINPSLITIPDRGKLRVRWGTRGQPADPALSKYGDTSPYDDRAGLVGEDFLFGRERTSSPNWEVVARRAPNQSIVTGSPAALDANGQANLVAFAAELVTSATGAGLPASKLYTPSWQAAADALDTPEMRSLFACSPLLTSQTKLRDLFESLGEISQIWARRRDDGKIELGRWSPPADLNTVPLITADDFTEDLAYDTSDMDELPTEYTISFTDGERLFKGSSERVPDLAAIRFAKEPKAENISHPEITRRAQARRLVAEYMRQRRGGALKGTAQVRRSKAIGIRPGDYFRIDIDTIPGGAGLAQLVKCMGRSFGQTGPIALDFESEPNSAPVPFAGAWGDNVPEIAPAIPPLAYQRSLSLPPAPGETPTLTVLAARPGDDLTGVQVLYDSDLSVGTFPTIGYLQTYALPVSLAVAVTTGATTVRVKTFAEFSAGIRADRERWLLADGAGVGDAEARDDTLLLFLLAKNHSTGVIGAHGDRHYLEVLSISSIALAAADTWDLGVLRGRLGTTPLAFDTSGGASFPDAFSYFEGWVIPRSGLARLSHADFRGLMLASASGFFRFRPYSRSGTYDPVVAHEAGLQATDAWTTYAFTWPSGYDIPANVIAYQYSLDGVSWHDVQAGGDLWQRQRVDDGPWSAPSYIATSPAAIAAADVATNQLIADVARDLAQLVTTAQDNASAVLAEIRGRILSVAGEASARGTAITQEQTLRQSGDDALALLVTNLTATVTGQGTTLGAHTTSIAAINTTLSAQATTNSSVASSISTLTASVSGNTTSISGLTTAQTATATNVDSLARDVAGLLAMFGDNSAAIGRELKVRADAVSAATDLITALSSTVGGHTGSIATINSTLSTQATTNSSVATSISTLTASVGTLNSSVSILASAYVVGGAAVATYGFKLGAGNKVVSMQAIAASGGAQPEVGVIVFGGCDLQSDNFNAGVSGWRGTHGGVWEMSTAIIRDSLVVNFEAAPSLDPVPQTFTSGSLTITATAASGATIRYTTNGRPVDSGSAVFPGGGLTVSDTTILRVRAYQTTRTSEETIAIYTKTSAPSTPKVASPAINAALLGSGGYRITITCATSGATIKFGVGSLSSFTEPSYSTYSGWFDIATSTNYLDYKFVWAYAEKSGSTTSDKEINEFDGYSGALPP